MTQEEKQLLLADLCARLPYGVILQLSLLEENTTDCRLTGIDEDGYLTADVPADCVFSVDDVKPYLRPLSSMTEEEKHYIDNRWGADNYGDIITYSSYESGVSTVELADIVGFHDWLNRKMFDYRGLIPKGLALEAPDGMYKMEE